MMHATVRRVWVRNNTGKRLFLGVPIPEPWSTGILEYVYRLRQSGRFDGLQANWTPPGNYHITLRFIGTVEDACIPKLIVRIRDMLHAIGPFTLPFERAELATDAEPKMIWIRFASTPEFAETVRLSTETISAFLRNECRGLELHNGHDVIPHVTVARFRRTAEDRAPLPGFRPPVAQLAIPAFVLYASKTTPEGSVYSTVASFRPGTGARFDML